MLEDFFADINDIEGVVVETGKTTEYDGFEIIDEIEFDYDINIDYQSGEFEKNFNDNLDLDDNEELTQEDEGPLISHYESYNNKEIVILSHGIDATGDKWEYVIAKYFSDYEHVSEMNEIDNIKNKIVITPSFFENIKNEGVQDIVNYLKNYLVKLNAHNYDISLVGHSLGGLVNARLVGETYNTYNFKNVVSIGTPYGTGLSHINPLSYICGIVKYIGFENQCLRLIDGYMPDINYSGTMKQIADATSWSFQTETAHMFNKAVDEDNINTMAIGNTINIGGGIFYTISINIFAGWRWVSTGWWSWQGYFTPIYLRVKKI